MIQLPDNLFKLSNNEVSIWFINLNTNEDEITSLSNFLSEDEILKASKFRFKKDKNYSIISRAVLRFWTRKESFIKAKAKGLSFPLDSFSVSIHSDEKAELLETKWDKN